MPTPQPAPARPRLRLAIIAVTLAALLVAGALVAAPARAEIEARLTDPGLATALLVAALYAVLTVGMVPGAALSLAIGALFGMPEGALVVFAGALAGATAAFLVARRLSRASVEAIAGRHVRRLDAHLERRGLLPVVVLRLAPFVPFNALNWAAGATALPLRTYVAGTAVGIVPGVVVFTAAGAGLGDPTSPASIAAFVALALLVAGSGVAARRVRAGAHSAGS